MATEIDNIFSDVRSAFRLLNKYQKRILNIVYYIKEQTPFTDVWGGKCYTDTIGTKKNSPNSNTKLAVWKNMWGYDFLYGHIFEYYFGITKQGKYNIEMSIFQISDDGFFISEQEDKHMTNVSSYASVEESHSYIIFNTCFYIRSDNKLWLREFASEDEKGFLTRFLSSSEVTKVVNDAFGGFSILKKYEMQNFVNLKGADDVIRNYAKLLASHIDVKLFKDSYYTI